MTSGILSPLCVHQRKKQIIVPEGQSLRVLATLAVALMHRNEV
jgi:hypothetical protein